MKNYPWNILAILVSLCSIGTWGMAQEDAAPAVPTTPATAPDKVSAPVAEPSAAPVVNAAPAPAVENAPAPAGENSAAPAVENAAPAPQVEKQLPKKGRGMLPRYYKSVVSEEQKLQIYDIQSQYRPQIRELQQKIDALKAEMNQKIENLLTEEQKEAIQAQKEARSRK